MKEYIYLIINKKRPALHSDPYEILGVEFTKERALKQEKIGGNTVIQVECVKQIKEE